MESCSNIFISMATQLDFSLTEKLTLNEKYLTRTMLSRLGVLSID